jgi:hypothetical protein
MSEYSPYASNTETLTNRYSRTKEMVGMVVALAIIVSMINSFGTKKYQVIRKWYCTSGDFFNNITQN